MTGDAVKVAIVGSGNIGTDLMIKLLEQPGQMELVMLAGIDPGSQGLARARELGIEGSDRGIDAILEEDAIRIVFDATSAAAHRNHGPRLRQAGKQAIDLTPAAIGPKVVPVVNINDHIAEANVNLITCGGQATVPLVHAVGRVAPLSYAEMVSTVASLSAGPGTRQNIDEFTATTARALETVGGAERGKAIIILNPADPPILMRNTVYAVPAGDFDEAQVAHSVEEMVSELQRYVPGYRLKSPPVIDTREFPDGSRRPVIVMLAEVEGAGDFLPTYAGNLDIMTAAARRVGELLAGRMLDRETSIV